MTAPELPPYTLEEARERFPPMWTIYDHPSDYPNEFVARMWYGLVPVMSEPLRAATLVELRELVVEAGGSMPLRRAEYDDPRIVESWI